MTLLKIPHSQASNILALYSPSEAITELATTASSPLELIDLAMTNELYSDAVTFLAHALPVRESVWWAVTCASELNHWNEHEANAIRAAKAWVYTPDETSRRFAEKMAELAGLDSGAGWSAQAAFWSGGSIIAEGDPMVPPPPYLYAQAVAGCISLSAVLPQSEIAQQRYHEFVDIGINIACGGNGKI